MPDPTESAEDRSARLVALLDLVERPAAAVSATGLLLGSNRTFQGFAEAIGLAGAVQIETLLTSVSREECRSRLASAIRSPASGERTALTFLDGRARPVRLERVGGDGETSVLLLVIDESDRRGAGLRARSSLSHDLAGPLTAILGTAELLSIRGAELPADVRDSIDHILENCGRISEILARGRAEIAGLDEEPR